ncbi:MAG: threonine synthase [Rhodopirellula sp.]|jgi:threonine synthase|uniref:Threonine synthase n=1 Tax=Rhodopirellula europaea SH398 TaxID=1263868 RepID=M5SC63_9BACT|nr:threonine synthase [Rhodopirellula europaea]EMI23719.1 threonine synthase [Rhodopirellula europaea SH398]MAP07421.1 threonine synthase [Rhodopirellula sp.]MCR9206681.1 threonine synthase [bacterium]|tara:strand:- start:58092 stop:59462 length:1371 start_codon:yes stop_codon:yes gene_type:complete
MSLAVESKPDVDHQTTYFRCISGCSAKHSIFDVIYTCPTCGSLLEVYHEREPLKKKNAYQWQQLFDSRASTSKWPFGSGVWGMREWVVPSLADENVVSMFEGNTNLFWAERLGAQLGVPDLWIKLCGNSHTGSFKDLGMTVLVSVVKQMMAQGSSVKAVACASTGDTSAALAAYAAYAGIPAVIFLPAGKVSTAQLIQPVANGAHVLALDTDFDGCMKIVQEVTKDNSIYLANSMNSLRIEGQKTVGIEMVRQFEWEVPDWIIIPVGNLGNISALYKGFKLMMDLGLINRMPRLVAAQTERANPFYTAYKNGFAEKVSVTAQDTLANAIRIGDPVSYAKAVKAVQETNGIVEQASENELAEASASADLTGMFTCPHTGVALAVLKKLIDRGEISSKDKTVVISTAHGLKFTDFKVGYHESTLEGIDSKHANPAVHLPADANAVKDEIARRLEQHNG